MEVIGKKMNKKRRIWRKVEEERREKWWREGRKDELKEH